MPATAFLNIPGEHLELGDEEHATLCWLVSRSSAYVHGTRHAEEAVSVRARIAMHVLATILTTRTLYATNRYGVQAAADIMRTDLEAHTEAYEDRAILERGLGLLEEYIARLDLIDPKRATHPGRLNA